MRDDFERNRGVTELVGFGFSSSYSFERQRGRGG